MNGWLMSLAMVKCSWCCEVERDGDGLKVCVRVGGGGRKK